VHLQKGAAAVVKQLLVTVKGTVGVTWGNTVWHLSQALNATSMAHPWRSHDPVQFVPLCGDPVMDSLGHYADRTSSRIASDLSQLLNGTEVRPAWLGLVPAFIPRDAQELHVRATTRKVKYSEAKIGNRSPEYSGKRDKETIWRMIKRVPQYPRIFGPADTPLADDLNMILTASGSTKSLVNVSRSLLALTPCEADLLAQGILGDIGGVVLPRMLPPSVGRPAPESLAIVNEVSDRWTGIRLRHLKQCASQARSVGDLRGARPGVALLSFRPDRVGVVLEAVKLGLVNHLIISADLESAIEEHLAL
jgi:hypothetical protein